MARARNIKPGFFKNADLVELPVEARLLFIGLWTLADRAGRLEDRPKQIKMELFPADSIDVDACLDGLQRWGFILRYEVDGRRLLQVVNFDKHQNPHRDEKVSALPAPDGSFDAARCKHGASTVQPQKKDGSDTVGIGLIPDSLIPDSRSLIPDSGNPDTAAAPPSAPKRAASDYSPEFEEAWESLPRRPNDSKADAFKAWKARLKDGKTAEAMTAGAARYAAYCRAEGTEAQYVKQGATFFGPGLHFEAAWSSTKANKSAETRRLLGFGNQEVIDA